MKTFYDILIAFGATIAILAIAFGFVYLISAVPMIVLAWTAVIVVFAILFTFVYSIVSGRL